MAFRKRNVALTRSDSDPKAPDLPSAPTTSTVPQPSPGVRPSPVDGRPTTSTGTSSLDAILAGHAGLPLGNSIIVGESGTTDYAGALLRFYAAEGVVQGHKVHVVGLGEAWGRELPGIAETKVDVKKRNTDNKMKIAWRYEGLGEFGARERGSPVTNRASSQVEDAALDDAPVFCHTFDLAKRLALPVGAVINYIPLTQTPQGSPFVPVLENLQHQLTSSPLSSIHRIVIPSLLSPALYSPSSSQPQYILQFLHALRALLRQYSSRLTAISTLPTTLFPRSTGLVRWMEILSDGVFELSPFPYNHTHALPTSGATAKEEEPPQGMFAVHKLPVFHEKGGGAVEGLGDDLAFTLSRRKFVIAKFSLPPMEGDREAQEDAAKGAQSSGMPKKEELEF